MTSLPEDLEPQDREQVEAAVFRRLVNHLQKRTDVQNIDLMILADFCRNCLGKWYRAEAEELGFDIADADARAVVYGMPYGEWKERYQQPATAEQMAAFEARHKS